VVRFLQAQGMSHSEIDRRLVSVYCQNVFSRKEGSVRRNLKNAERH
jgi:hypothetical protein